VEVLPTANPTIAGLPVSVTPVRTFRYRGSSATRSGTQRKDSSQETRRSLSTTITRRVHRRDELDIVGPAFAVPDWRPAEQ
jgi:hypothetical protein